MSFLKSKLLRLCLFGAAVFTMVLATAALVAFKVVLPREINFQIAKFSEQTGVEIRLESTNYDLLRGVEGKGISMSEIINIADPFLTVRNLVLKPDIVSSFFSARIRIKCSLEGPVVTLNEDTIKSLGDYLAGSEEGAESDGEGKGFFTVELSSLEIRDARVSLSSGRVIELESLNLSSLTQRGQTNGREDGSKRVLEIEGKMYGGTVNARVIIDEAARGSKVSSSIQLKDILIPSWGSYVHFGKVDLSFEEDIGSYSPGTPRSKMGGKLGGRLTGHIENLTSHEFVPIQKARAGYNGSLVVDFLGATIGKTAGETIGASLELINNETGGSMNVSSTFDGGLHISVPEFEIANFVGLISPFLSTRFQQLEASGGVSAEVEYGDDAGLNGRVKFNGVDIGGFINGGRFSATQIEGELPIGEPLEFNKVLSAYKKATLKDDKKSFARFTKKNAKNISDKQAWGFQLRELGYGFFTLTDIKCFISAGRGFWSVSGLSSHFYRGKLVGEASFEQESGRFYLGFLVDGASLDSFTEDVGLKDYLSGRVNAMGELAGQGGDFDSYNGSFSLWSIKSDEEPRRVGRAFLRNLGMSKKMLLGKYRKYNKGNVYTKIMSGLLTFKEFSITNRSLFVTDLRVQADPRMNSITLEHLLGVIRETSKRVQEGSLNIEVEQ